MGIRDGILSVQLAQVVKFSQESLTIRIAGGAVVAEGKIEKQ